MLINLYDLLHTIRSPVNFAGLEAPLEKSVNISFHVLILKALWEWDPQSRLYIRFGHPKLGDWSDCGEFQEKQYVYSVIWINNL